MGQRREGRETHPPPPAPCYEKVGSLVYGMFNEKIKGLGCT